MTKKNNIKTTAIVLTEDNLNFAFVSTFENRTLLSATTVEMEKLISYLDREKSHIIVFEEILLKNKNKKFLLHCLKVYNSVYNKFTDFIVYQENFKMWLNKILGENITNQSMVSYVNRAYNLDFKVDKEKVNNEKNQYVAKSIIIAEAIAHKKIR